TAGEEKPALCSLLLCGEGGGALFGNAPDGRFQVSRFEALGRLPETLEFIVPARLFGEDVDNEIDIVEQDPFRLTVAFRMRRIKTLALQTQFDFVRDRLDLAWIRPTAHDEIVRERARTLLEFQYGDFFSLLFLTGGDRFGDLSAGFVGLHESVVNGKLFWRWLE